MRRIKHTVVGLAALLFSLLGGCAHIPDELENPYQLADALEFACQVAPPPLPAEVQKGCDTVPDALRLAADTGKDVRELVAKAKDLIAKVRG